MHLAMGRHLVHIECTHKKNERIRGVTHGKVEGWKVADAG